MKTLIISLKIFLFFTILTGLIYPLAVTGIAQVLFPSKSNGSLITKNDKVIGSELIGQQFDSVIYFSSRPSAISYNPLPSGGSNLGLTSTKLKDLVTGRKSQFISCNRLDSNVVVPSEMVFASASGLDPHISPAAALMQVNRVAKARNLKEFQKKQLIDQVNSLIEVSQFGVLGEKRLNVLELNLKMDLLFSN